MKSRKQVFLKMLTWLLISQYAAFHVGWDFLHERVHHEVAVAHTVQQELNACHRSIFHGEQDQHKSHYTSQEDCAACHVNSHVPHFIEARDCSSFTFPELRITDYQILPTLQVDAFIFSSRAPPALV